MMVTETKRTSSPKVASRINESYDYGPREGERGKFGPFVARGSQLEASIHAAPSNATGSAYSTRLHLA